MDTMEISIIEPTGELDISQDPIEQPIENPIEDPIEQPEKDESFTEVKKKSTRGRKPKDPNSQKKEKEFKTPHFVGSVPQKGTQKLDDTKLDNILKITAGQKLLGNKEVIRWLYGDLSFLSKQTQKEENDWGMKVIKAVLPELKSKKQWTNAFSESIMKEVGVLLKEPLSKPEAKNHLQPDFETKTDIIEVKSGTFFTNGTAHEKIMGCAMKYAEVPRLYGKELQIWCMGNAEKLARDTYQILKTSQNVPEEKKTILKCYKELKIKFFGLTELIDQLITN